MALHPIIKWTIGIATFVVAAEIMVGYIPPAWSAASIQVTDRIVIELGDVPQWIIALVAAAGFWMTWRKASVGVAKIDAVAVQIDGLLAERDKAKVKEGEQKGRQAGVEAAEQLAEGQRQGRESERARTPPRAAPQNPNTSDPPLPVADDRTAKASERVAEATERVAAATEEKSKPN